MNVLMWGGWMFGGAMLGIAAALGWLLYRARRGGGERTTLAPKANEELAAIRLAARGVRSARDAYAAGKGKPGEEQLLYAVDEAERVLLDAALDTLEQGLSFEEALIVVQSGRLVGRRGRMGVVYRWETIADGAGILEVKVGDGRWRTFEPSPEDKKAMDWVRRASPMLTEVLDGTPVSRVVARGRPSRGIEIVVREGAR